MDFSSFSAFCEHLNKSSQIAATTASTIPTTLNNGNGIYLEVNAKNTTTNAMRCDGNFYMDTHLLIKMRMQKYRENMQRMCAGSKSRKSKRDLREREGRGEMEGTSGARWLPLALNSLCSERKYKTINLCLQISRERRTKNVVDVVATLHGEGVRGIRRVSHV